MLSLVLWLEVLETCQLLYLKYDLQSSFRLMTLAKVKTTGECQKPVGTLMKYQSWSFGSASLCVFDWETFSIICIYINGYVCGQLTQFMLVYEAKRSILAL